MGLDLTELKGITNSFKTASVRKNVSDDQVKTIIPDVVKTLSNYPV